MAFVYLNDPERFMDNLMRIPEAKARGAGRPASTWPWKKWNFLTFIAAGDIGPSDVYTPKPKGYRRSETIPEIPVLPEAIWILVHALPPLLLHAMSAHVFPDWKWGIGFSFLIYHIFFIRFAAKMIVRLHGYMGHYGTFDEENRARDLASDTKVKRLALGIYIYLNLRVLGTLLMSYDKTKYPLDGLSVFTPFKMAAWTLALDYYFYAYHRSCHQVPWLWHIHRTHHSTAHPTPLLSILADDFQEFLEIFLIPFLATLTVPLSFPELWLAACMMLYVEAMGHSGIRAYLTHPLLGRALQLINMDLCVEDHDIHHRGGRGGQNYCKASRVWDRLFGTAQERVEIVEGKTSKDEAEH